MTMPPTGTTPLPVGFRITVDSDTRQVADGAWFGGRPARLVRFTPAGHRAWQQLRSGPVVSTRDGELARRLTDTGLAHPYPPPMTGRPDLTVVIPVRDRPLELERCLSALGDRYPVVVVDDGSADAWAVAAVAARPGVTVLRHEHNRGPAAARNTALTRVRTDLVAFLDSDCVPGPEWIDRLAAHFADPMVAAVAPRVTALRTGSGIRCGLDLGARPALVRPNSRVAFLPTAALLARRGALYDIARAGTVFDPGMRVGEDVDLVWRLHEAGWRIRYDPSVHVAHDEPASLPRLLSRRFRYGTSAAPLARRHPESIPPLVTSPWYAATVVALLVRQPLPAALAFTTCLHRNAGVLERAGLSAEQVMRLTVAETFRTWLGFGRYGTQFAAPLLGVLAVAPGKRRWGRRIAIGSLLLGPALAGWVADRPEVTARSVPQFVADDLAYGCGVIAGCLRHRTIIPLRPVFIRRPGAARAAQHPLLQGVSHGR